MAVAKIANPEVSPSRPTRSSRSVGTNFLTSSYQAANPLSIQQGCIGNRYFASCFSLEGLFVLTTTKKPQAIPTGAFSSQPDQNEFNGSLDVS